jgi:hypothetical protein
VGQQLEQIGLAVTFVPKVPIWEVCYFNALWSDDRVYRLENGDDRVIAPHLPRLTVFTRVAVGALVPVVGLLHLLHVVQHALHDFSTVRERR